jgi:hypothetical protein
MVKRLIVREFHVVKIRRRMSDGSSCVADLYSAVSGNVCQTET